jgi:small subunit ribosomal protein S9
MVSNLEVNNSINGVQSSFYSEKKPKLDKYGRAYATGRRKVAVARVWIKPGKGNFIVNKKEIHNFFSEDSLVSHAKSPLLKTNSIDSFDIYSTVKGGGVSGQAGALRHAISRALDNFNPVLYHNILKANSFLTRDSRMVQSKRYGRHKARRGIQFSKR